MISVGLPIFSLKGGRAKLIQYLRFVELEVEFILGWLLNH